MIQFQGAIWMSPEPYEWRVGERSVSPLIGIAEMDRRPSLESPKRSVAVPSDDELFEAFKSKGKGWQIRMNEDRMRTITATLGVWTTEDTSRRPLCLDHVNERPYVV